MILALCRILVLIFVCHTLHKSIHQSPQLRPPIFNPLLRLRDTILISRARLLISIQNIGLQVLKILASVFAELKHYATVFMVCSNSTTIGAGPDPSTFRLARSRPEL